MTNPTHCVHCLEAEAVTGEPAHLCAECYAIAAGGVDPSDAERLAGEGVYSTPLDAFASLVASRVDAAINGDATLDGRPFVAGKGYAPAVTL